MRFTTTIKPTDDTAQRALLRRRHIVPIDALSCQRNTTSLFRPEQRMIRAQWSRNSFPLPVVFWSGSVWTRP